MCVNALMDLSPIPCVLPQAQCSQYRSWIHHNPDQDKALTECEWVSWQELYHDYFLIVDRQCFSWYPWLGCNSGSYIKVWAWFIDFADGDITIFEFNVLVHITVKDHLLKIKVLHYFKKTCKGDTHRWWLTLSTLITLTGRQFPEHGNFCTRHIEMHTKIRLCWRAKQTASYRKAYTPVQNKMVQYESPYNASFSSWWESSHPG